MNTEKLLKNSIKIAAVCLTSPATWQVSGSLYQNPFQRILVQLAALVLVEGALMLGWWQLDNDRKAEMPQRVLYATLAGIAYIALWSIAIEHGEGAAGITLRLTLGVLLGYSIFESGILAGVKLRRSQDRDIANAPAVKRKRRNKFTAVERKRIDSEAKIAEQEIQTNEAVAIERLEQQRIAALESVRLSGKRDLASVRADDRQQRATMPDLSGSDTTIQQAQQQRATQQAMEKATAIQHILTTLANNPNPNKTTLADEIGRARTTLYDYLSEMESDGLIRADGEGYAVVNGNGHKVTA
jgi:hypothetical protein